MHKTPHTDYFSPQAKRVRMRRLNKHKALDRVTVAAYSDAEIAAKRKAQSMAIAASRRHLER